MGPRGVGLPRRYGFNYIRKRCTCTLGLELRVWVIVRVRLELNYIIRGVHIDQFLRVRVRVRIKLRVAWYAL